MTQLAPGRPRSPADSFVGTDSEKGPFVSALLVALRERRLIACAAVLFPLIVVGFTLWGPRSYTATATFVPEGRRAASVASGLAAQLGVAVDASDASDSPAFYVDLLTSREILNSLLDSVEVSVDGRSVRLMDYLVRNARDSATQRARGLDSLRRAIGATHSRRTSVVTVSATARQPALAQALAQRTIYELSRFNLERRQSKASAERRFTETRLNAVRGDLRAAEDDLKGFLQRNRSGASPELEFQRDRLTREVNLRQQLYTTLSQSYEQARIDEVRDTPVLTVIENPAYPHRPRSRQVVRKFALALVAGLFLGFCVAYVKDRFSSLEDRDRHSRQELSDLWQLAREDMTRVLSLGRRSRSRRSSPA